MRIAWAGQTAHFLLLRDKSRWTPSWTTGARSAAFHGTNACQVEVPLAAHEIGR